MNARILLIEADAQLAENLCGVLKAEGHHVDALADGQSGLVKACSGTFDLIVLDAAVSGFEVCRELRQSGGDTAILMLAAPAQCVAGLRLGADDCVSQQCDPRELAARVEAILRRTPGIARNALKTIRFSDVTVDFRLGEAHKGGRTINLTARELQLLQYLVEHRNKVVARQEILRNVWEYETNAESRTIDVHIGLLRQKLEDNPQDPKHIKTVRNRGYRFD